MADVVALAMDTEAVVQFVSTILIVWMIAALGAANAGVGGLQTILLTATGFAVAIGAPLAFLLVFVLDVESTHIGPWDVEDLVFLVAVVPPLAGGVWLVREIGLTGIPYFVSLLFIFVVSVAFAVIVRDATVGQWPPGSAMREEREGGPPGERP